MKSAAGYRTALHEGYSTLLGIAGTLGVSWIRGGEGGGKQVREGRNNPRA